MIKNTYNNISLYKSEKLDAFSDITHFFSTRHGGVSEGVFNSLNFGTHHGEAENMKKNLCILKDSIGCADFQFSIPHQTHSDVIAVVNELNVQGVFDNTDALITNLHGIFVCIKTADCVPILLFDPVMKVVGAVHSGWKGTAQNIVGKTIDKMRQVYGCIPSHIIAAIGPCIGHSNYEVGNEVTNSIMPLLHFPGKAIIKKYYAENKFYLNLTEANFQLLLQAGLKEINIDTNDLCTYSLSSDFFSARRDGSKTGRMINGIAIR